MKKVADTEQLAQMRFDQIVERISRYKADLASRLAATHKLFDQKVLAVDIHTHSNYSDGRGTVAQNHTSMNNAGLDFIFATDHSSLGQKRVVRQWSDASWGQEPVPRDGKGRHFMHHIGLLCGNRRFRPRADSAAADFARARKIAPFVWIPHPVGWYPANWYGLDKIEALWTLGDTFAMEVMNGAHKVVRAYDAFDRKAVSVWDRLLCDGKKVTALGASDAHLPDEIGSVWTGVYAARRTATSIIKTLNNGRCFASEASLLDFTCDSQFMGETVRKKNGTELALKFRVADSVGIASVRIISQGRVLREIHTRGQTVVEDRCIRKVSNKPVYYRLESTATDDRRAFSTPVYVKPIDTRP